MNGRKVIFFELNEVPFRILDYYCQKYAHSTLAKKLPYCYQYQTYTTDTILSPWITWASLHRGVSANQHSIHHFGQDLSLINQNYPPIWQILANAGIRTGVFASLHSYPLPQSLYNYAFYVPDSFASSSKCFPEYLSVFQEFNLAMTRLSGRNVSTKVPQEATKNLLLNIHKLGLKLHTFIDIARQLIQEQIQTHRKNRRRIYQTVLSFDLFSHQLQASKPDFASFFTNHVASVMHRYWAAAFPQDYQTLGYSHEWISKYKWEIDFAMHKFNQSFSRLIQFVEKNPEYTLWIASSMGQESTQAWSVKTQLYLTNIDKFMSALSIPNYAWSSHRTMFPEVGVVIEVEWKERFFEKIRDLKIAGKPLEFSAKPDGLFALFFGHVNLPEKQIDSVEIAGQIFPLESLGLENIPIEDETNTNAYHIPEGLLLIYDPLESTFQPHARTQISTLEITPMLLNNFSIPIPEYMHTSGKSPTLCI
ncbi:MAG: hypothetical protein ICV54_07330 [Nostoc sp. C3-bin3]|nr:hypothetical protein [Nostoc sp. C3-bin3]